MAVATKEHEDWLADYFKAAPDELGYGGCRVAIKCDNARELLKLREAISARRTAPTVPITVPIKESRGNGAVERAVRTWQGQFRTLKDHAEFELGAEFGPRHPMLTWCAWWSAALLNRVKIQESGRTAYELYTGHLAKVPMAAFGERCPGPSQVPASSIPSGRTACSWASPARRSSSQPRKELGDQGMCGDWSTESVGINDLWIHARRHSNRI